MYANEKETLGVGARVGTEMYDAFEAMAHLRGGGERGKEEGDGKGDGKGSAHHQLHSLHGRIGWTKYQCGKAMWNIELLVVPQARLRVALGSY